MQVQEVTSILPLLKNTYDASSTVRRLSSDQKNVFLKELSDQLIQNIDQIIVENNKDLARMETSDPKYDRLKLTKERIEDLAKSIIEIMQLPDPADSVLLEKTLENGLKLKKIAVPLGVVGIIYEARPNVTIDITALCIRSGNAVVLRGGSDAYDTNSYLVSIIKSALTKSNIDSDVVTLLPPDRALVLELLTATKYVDLIIPRGSDSLIQFVRKNSLVPTIETGAGVCHTYIETNANINKAIDIVVNAKTSRPSVCNALDTIVVDQAVAQTFLTGLQENFVKWNIEVFADNFCYDILSKNNYPYLQKASEEDFGREFLDYKCSIKSVANIQEALEHIKVHSSKHSEAIISEDKNICELFIKEVDAAAVYSNASTRFTDGGAFGLGAEIGISTQKIHARGPFALEKMVTEKWIITGNGQTR